MYLRNHGDSNKLNIDLSHLLTDLIITSVTHIKDFSSLIVFSNDVPKDEKY